MAGGPEVVILAAGSSTRFGEPKQLVAIRPDGSTIIDVLLHRCTTAGYARAVVVVAPSLENRLRVHLDGARRPELPVEIVTQQTPRGTADAVLAAREAIDGAFVVVNADDLYPEDAFALLSDHLTNGAQEEHAMVAFRLDRTLFAPRPVSRALIESDHGLLTAIEEGTVERDGGLRFDSGSTRRPLRGDELISMNMWGFRPSAIDAIADAVAAASRSGEVYLPRVVATMIASGAVVRVLTSNSSVVGLTHPEDLPIVRAALS
jgi:bifunctional N-acetylglucosamine-1-phosphate-uridyltransferase/glucosamine-1-phosphate-acetyltransferase GlmU-like protein